jgi:hypothetical protein
MSQVMGVYGLMYFTIVRPFSLGERFQTYEPFIALIFHFFSGRGKPRILDQWIWGHDSTTKATSAQRSLYKNSGLSVIMYVH